MRPKLRKYGDRWYLLDMDKGTYQKGKHLYPIVMNFFTLEEAMTTVNNKGPWLYRRDSDFPSQTWCPFKFDEIVEVANQHSSKVGYVHEFWWGYESGIDGEESVIRKARKVCFA